MVETLAAEIEKAQASGEIELQSMGVDATAVASIVMQALEGLKADAIRGNPVEDNVSNLIRFVSNALTARAR